MQEVFGKITDKEALIRMSGRINSGNAHEVEQEIRKILEKAAGLPVKLDFEKLEYISSAGLRVLLHIRKAVSGLSITNVISDVYEILEMTGFTEMIPVEKSYRTVSVEGCEEIGRGANGTIYRIDEDNIVKVYNNADALEEIRHEREVAKLALILGIPTAIPYDIVHVGDSYGSVFEMLHARTFSEILAAEPEKMDWCVQEYVDMLKKIHGTVVPEGKLPDMRETVLVWVQNIEKHLPEEAGRKLRALIEAVPRDDHMIHGDYHTKNLELQGEEVLMIDMETLAVGYPVFEFGYMFNSYIGFSELDHEQVRLFQGYDHETAVTFWHKTLETYLDTTSEEKIREFEDKARVVGYTRLINRSIRVYGTESEEGRMYLDHWRGELLEVLGRVDSLLI